MAQATCSCGIFAIGQCSQCDRPVCGVHGKLFEGRLTCVDDIKQAQLRAKEEAEAAKEAADMASDETAISTILSRVEAGPDAISRWLLRLGTQWYSTSTADPYRVQFAPFKREEALRECISSLRELVKGAGGGEQVDVSGEMPGTWTVSDADLLRWLASRSQPTVVMPVGMFRTMTGWIIGEGSQTFQGDYHGGGSTYYYRLFVATDGRVFQVNKDDGRIEKWRLLHPSTLGEYASHLVKFI